MVVVTLMLMMMMVARAGGHGMMMEPTQRSSMWRFPARFPHAPVNYDDDELFCGGASVMHDQNHHLCGVCGDAYHLHQPRPNEAGGRYGRGVIAATYTQGQIIDVTIRLTTNHLGYFMFKICPNNDVTRIVTQDCLDKTVLQPVDASGQPIGDRWPVTDHLSNDHKLRLQLPPGLTCTQCVLQWWYTAGNTWGCDSTGQCGEGMGDQETFVNCADVAISPSGGSLLTQQPAATTATSPPTTSATTHQRPTTMTTHRVTHPPTSTTHQPTAATAAATHAPQTGSGTNCRDATGYESDDWCISNCAMGYCPANFCKCT